MIKGTTEVQKGYFFFWRIKTETVHNTYPQWGYSDEGDWFILRGHKSTAYKSNPHATFDNHTWPEACSNLEPVFLRHSFFPGSTGLRSQLHHPDNSVLFGTGSWSIHAYKHAFDTPKHWPEQLVPWTGFKPRVYLGAEAYITAGWEQTQTWKSCVYSLLRGHVRVHPEEQAAEALIEMKSYGPTSKHVKVYWHDFRVLTSQTFTTQNILNALPWLGCFCAF